MKISSVASDILIFINLSEKTIFNPRHKATRFTTLTPPAKFPPLLSSHRRTLSIILEHFEW